MVFHPLPPFTFQKVQGIGYSKFRGARGQRGFRKTRRWLSMRRGAAAAPSASFPETSSEEEVHPGRCFRKSRLQSPCPVQVFPSKANIKVKGGKFSTPFGSIGFAERGEGRFGVRVINFETLIFPIPGGLGGSSKNIWKTPCVLFGFGLNYWYNLPGGWRIFFADSRGKGLP